MPNESTVFKTKTFFIGIEDTIGGGANSGAGLDNTSTLLFMDGTMTVTEEKEVLSFDSDSGRDNPEDVTDRNWEFTGKTPLSYPAVPGTSPPISPLMLCCGFDEDADPVLKTVKYRPSNVGAIDTAHAAFRRKKASKDLIYESKGMRGIFGIKIKLGKRIDITGVSLKGSYEQPSEVDQIVSDLTAQKSNLNQAVKAATIETWVLGTDELCAQEFEAGNASGIELQKGSTRCDEDYEASEITPTGTVIYKETDYVANNPWPVKGSATDLVGVPFTIIANSPSKGRIKFHCAKTQAGTPKEVALDDGNVGISRELRFLSDIEIDLLEAT